MNEPPYPQRRQADLLASAGRHLAGGGLGLFQLPPDLNLVVERGEGARVWDIAGRWDPLESTCRHASLSIL